MQSFISGLGHVPSPIIDLLVFVWLAAESCGVPLPNELVLLLAGSIAAQRSDPIGLIELAVVATLGSLVGASAAYYIGARGGRALIIRLGRYVGLNPNRLDMVERWFARSGPVAIGIARVTPFVRTVSSFPAGILRMPPRAFYLATTIGSLIWCAALVSVGYLLGVHYMLAVHLIEEYTVPAILALAILAAAYIWLHRRLARLGAATSSATAERAARQPTASRARRNG